ncbi:MAG: hypothetical protein RSD04_01925 [Clostridia bacterium]
MLTGQSTEVLQKLCDLLQDGAYKVLEWKEIFDAEEFDDATAKKIWRELKFNQCVDVKFSDEEEVCFAVTDKSRLIVQELAQMALEKLSKNTFVKTDNQGRTCVVIPNEELQDSSQAVANAVATVNLPTKKQGKKGGIKAFFWGVLGGLFGGGIGGGIVYAILNFLIGG